MHAGRRQRVAYGGEASVPWRLSRSVIDSVGPAGAEFARNCRIFCGPQMLAAQAVIVQISRSGVTCLCRAGAPEGSGQAPENLACTPAPSRHGLSVTGTD